MSYVRNAGCVEDEVLPVMFDPFRGGKKRHNAKGLGLIYHATDRDRAWRRNRSHVE